MASPARQAFQAREAASAVTGTRYESGGHITGPFDMGAGKITGTEQFRFDARRMPEPMMPLAAPAAMESGNPHPPPLSAPG